MPNTVVLVVLAIIPAVIIFGYIFYKDKVEKEPIGLLVGLFFLGALTIVGAGVLEVLLEKLLKEVAYSGGMAYNFIMCFLIIAPCEEGFKFLVLRTVTWKNRNFNYTFDAIVYAVVISLGFATVENIMYVVEAGTYNIAMMRGLLSVPGHAIDAVFMGLFFGKAKYCQCVGDNSGKSKNMFMAFLAPVLTHGFYDFCLFSEKIFEGALVLFFIFVVAVTAVAFVVIHNNSKRDSQLPGMGVPFYQFPSYPYNYYSQQMQYQNYQQNYQQQSYYTPNGYMNGSAQNYQQNQYQNNHQNQYQNYQPNQYQGYQQNQYQNYGQYAYSQLGQNQPQQYNAAAPYQQVNVGNMNNNNT